MVTTFLLLLCLGAPALGGWFTPEQVSLSWTENENEMRVTYVTLKSCPFDSYVAYRPVNCASAEG
jgi:hypothetical protein